MSTIQLTSFLTYHQGHVPKQAILNNIPMPKNVNAPEGSLVTYYGFHDALAGLAQWRREADKGGLGFCSVKLTTEIGKAVTVHLNPELLPETKFLSFARMTRALEDKIIGYYRQYLTEEGMSPEDLKQVPWRNQGYVMERPDLLARLHKEPEFQHIDVMVYPVLEEDNQVRQKTAIFNTDAIVEITPVDEPSIEVFLPNLAPRVDKKASPRV